MDFSLNLTHFYQRPFNQPSRSFKKTVNLVKDAGFNCLDFNGEFIDKNYLEQTKKQIDVIKSLGMYVHQSHAPFNRYG